MTTPIPLQLVIEFEETIKVVADRGSPGVGVSARLRRAPHFSDVLGLMPRWIPDNEHLETIAVAGDVL